MLSISFWLKETGNCMSHTAGLTKEQVEALQALKEGDRLIMWKNDRPGEQVPSFTMKVYKKEYR